MLTRKMLHFNFGVSFAFLSEHSSNSMLFDKYMMKSMFFNIENKINK